MYHFYKGCECIDYKRKRIINGYLWKTRWFLTKDLNTLKEKYPREIYYEVINAFRNIKAKIDFYKLNQYIKSFKNGGVLLTKIKEIIW